MTKNKPRLGKGLSALIPDNSSSATNSNKTSNDVLLLDPRTIKKNPYQPRLNFDAEALEELKQSIKENGLIQPIAVRKVGDDFELIAGERRLRSVIDLGLEEVPAFLLQLETKEEMLEVALIENVQREHLNIIELASSYNRLIEECQLTIENVAQKIGKNRSTINNILRLLKLPKYTQEKLVRSEISMGHARALLGLSDTGKINELAKQIAEKELSVRKVEQLVRFSNDSSEKETPLVKKETKTNSLFHSKMEDNFRATLGTKVKIKPKKKGGLIELEYYNEEDLLRLAELFEGLDN